MIWLHILSVIKMQTWVKSTGKLIRSPQVLWMGIRVSGVIAPCRDFPVDESCRDEMSFHNPPNGNDQKRQPSSEIRDRCHFDSLLRWVWITHSFRLTLGLKMLLSVQTTARRVVNLTRANKRADPSLTIFGLLDRPPRFGLTTQTMSFPRERTFGTSLFWGL